MPLITSKLSPLPRRDHDAALAASGKAASDATKPAPRIERDPPDIKGMREREHLMTLDEREAFRQRQASHARDLLAQDTRNLSDADAVAARRVEAEQAATHHQQHNAEHAARLAAKPRHELSAIELIAREGSLVG